MKRPVHAPAWAAVLSAALVLCSCATPPVVVLDAEVTRGVSVPLSFEGAMPIVEMRVDGQVLRIGLDTGADGTTVCLTPSALARVQPEWKEGAAARWMGVSGTVYAGRRFALHGVELGGIGFATLEGVEEVRDLPGFDGLIGNSVLDRFSVLIDYARSEMTLFPRGGYPSEVAGPGWTRVPFNRTRVGIIVPGRLAPEREARSFCLDTGFCLRNERGSFGSIRSAYVTGITPEGRMRVPGLFSGERPYIQTGHFMLGDLDCGPQLFLVHDFPQPPVDGLLGYPIFRDWRVFIDFEGRVLLLQRGGAAPDAGAGPA